MTDPRWCSFAVADLECALPARDIEEVVRHMVVTPVPLAGPAVRGIAQLRGRVMPVLDLRRCLGLADREAGTVPMHLIVRTADGPLSLEVDRIHEVIDVDHGSLEPPPETLAPAIRDLLAGTFATADRLILLIELEQVLARIATGAAPIRVEAGT